MYKFTAVQESVSQKKNTFRLKLIVSHERFSMFSINLSIFVKLTPECGLLINPFKQLFPGKFFDLLQSQFYPQC